MDIVVFALGSASMAHIILFEAFNLYQHRKWKIREKQWEARHK